MSVAERRRQGGSDSAGVDSSLSNLSLSQSKGKPHKLVADSWEDEDEDGNEEDSEPTTPTGQQQALPSALHAPPIAPPPTPASPSGRFENPYALPTEFPTKASRRGEDGDTKRPEKTTSTATRMIAGALGMKAPRKGEDMRAYESAAVEKEKARKNRDRSEKEEEERRKRSVWED